MLLTVLSLETVGLGAAVGAADGLGGAADGLGVAVVAADGLGGAADGLACGAVDGLTGTISADTTPLGALRDRSSLGGGRERERGSVDAGMSDCSMTGLPNKAPVFFLGGGLDASRPTDPIWYTSGLFGAAFTGP